MMGNESVQNQFLVFVRMFSKKGKSSKEEVGFYRDHGLVVQTIQILKSAFSAIIIDTFSKKAR